MTKFELMIYNPDGSLYWREYFQTKKELNGWLSEEKTRPYWRKDFRVETVDNSVASEKSFKEARESLEAAQAAEKTRRQEMKAAIKAFKEKPTKTIADVAKVLDVLIDVLDLKPD